MRRLVGGVKRSPTYRLHHVRLASRCPLDVWTEDDLGFVQFPFGGENGDRAGWAIFAVKMETGQVVAAKSLIPDQRGAELLVSELLSP